MGLTSLNFLHFDLSLTEAGEMTSSEAPEASSDSPSDPNLGFSCTTPENYNRGLQLY